MVDWQSDKKYNGMIYHSIREDFRNWVLLGECDKAEYKVYITHLGHHSNQVRPVQLTYLPIPAVEYQCTSLTLLWHFCNTTTPQACTKDMCQTNQRLGLCCWKIIFLLAYI